MTDPQTLATRLAQARRSIGLTQEDVSGALGLSRPAISAIENGDRQVTALELKRFARLYQRPITWLLGEDVPVDEEIMAAVAHLSPADQDAVISFAQFLAGQAKAPPPEEPEPEHQDKEL